MLFNSFEFIFFLCAITLAYFALPQRYRTGLLLAASYYFYMRWKWGYIFLIVGMTLFNYECARRISATTSPRARRAWLGLAATVSIGAVFVFKYANFAGESANAVFEALRMPYLIPHLGIILPVGISFFSFQALSYTIDVYRGHCEAEPSLTRFALYIAFFPQLVAGPIERAPHLLGQFRRENHFDIDRAVEGVELILWGLFKKVVIADRLAIYVNRVYEDPDRYSGSSLLLATVFFAFQIYCDFSAYSDIAIGSARVLGYDLMQNFRLPYLAKSIGEFWKRWHISLSTWFADYVYLPLGGNRVSVARWVFNIAAVFLLSGLWHGANWTFVIWGGLHAGYYLFERVGRSLALRLGLDRRLPALVTTPLRVGLTFILVTFAWVFFRANCLSDALLIVRRIFAEPLGPLSWGASQLTTALGMALIGLVVVVQMLQAAGIISLYFSRSRVPRPLRWCAYLGLVLGIALLGMSSNQFIYFQF
jgi:alginate O-acetyltransferase complex protein AlgI